MFLIVRIYLCSGFQIFWTLDENFEAINNRTIDVNFGKLVFNAGGKVFQIDSRSGHFIKNLSFEYITSIIFKKVELTVPIDSSAQFLGLETANLVLIVPKSGKASQILGSFIILKHQIRIIQAKQYLERYVPVEGKRFL